MGGMATYFEPQVFEKDGAFLLTITTSTPGSQWTSGAVRLAATSRDEAGLEGVNKTLDYASAILGVDRAELLKAALARRAIGWDPSWVRAA